jgi:hypothetical protein
LILAFYVRIDLFRQECWETNRHRLRDDF